MTLEAFYKKHWNYSPLLFSGGWWSYFRQNGWKSIPSQEVEAVAVRHLLKGGEVKTKTVGNLVTLIRGVATIPTMETTCGVSVTMGEENALSVSPSENWIPTRNKLVNVATSETRARSAELFLPGMVPCDYDPQAKCPQWEAFLREACPEDGKALQASFGLSLTFDRRFNRFFILFGESGTGKSTALSVLAALNAGACCGVSLGAFGEPFRTFPLAENRLNLVQDMDSIFEGSGSVSRREAVLKSLTCGKKIRFNENIKMESTGG